MQAHIKIISLFPFKVKIFWHPKRDLLFNQALLPLRSSVVQKTHSRLQTTLCVNHWHIPRDKKRYNKRVMCHGQRLSMVGRCEKWTRRHDLGSNVIWNRSNTCSIWFCLRDGTKRQSCTFFYNSRFHCTRQAQWSTANVCQMMSNSIWSQVCSATLWPPLTTRLCQTHSPRGV